VRSGRVVAHGAISLVSHHPGAHGAGGRSNKELGVTESTLKTFVLGVLGKLGVDDRTGAAVAAIRRGLEHPEAID
jgi:hypothetical protein